MSDSSLPYVREKEEFGEVLYETISDTPKIGQGDLLTIYGVLFLKDMESLENKYICIYFIVCVLLRRYQKILYRNRRWNRETHTLS